MRDTREQLPTAASLFEYHVFTVGLNRFLIPSERVSERVTEIRTHTLPGLRGWIAKAEHAGQELPVIDLRRRFSVRPSRSVHEVETSPAMIVKWNMCSVGLAIDTLDSASIEIDSKEVLVIRPTTDFPIMGVVTFEARPCYVLSFEVLMADSATITALALARALLGST